MFFPLSKETKITWVAFKLVKDLNENIEKKIVDLNFKLN